MPELTNELGKIIIDRDIIRTIAALAVRECYGLVRMVSKTGKEGLSGFLRRDDGTRGVEIAFGEDNRLIIRLHVVVEYGIKIPEVAKNIRERVSSVVADMTGFEVREVNISVEDIRVGKLT